ncbi:MAG: anthranilate synthase component I [Candidatus Wallbacteria bacterium]|nr:anthranilate synthase component I [Candidatus Wallbacteria bacterium]
MNASALSKHPFYRKLPLKSFPVSAYSLLYSQEEYSFIYESLESSGERGRYSFIGGRPFLIFRSTGNKIELEVDGVKSEQAGNPLDLLRELTGKYKGLPEIPVFSGGALGYISYDAIRLIEKIPDKNPDELGISDTFFIFPSEIILFDHLENTVTLVLYAETEPKDRFGEIVTVLAGCLDESGYKSQKSTKTCTFSSNFTQSGFEKIVEKSKEYILSGDIFQVVLSQRLSFDLDATPFSVYRSLRKSNPSPYMYFLRLSDMHILGSSPETLIKVHDGIVVSRPLAGTRPRGETEERDLELEQELLADEQERAEHVMLVDLARNDIGRVCEYGSVKATELFQVERYSRVMHIVSNVVGRLASENDMFDLFRACFPAGTVSGAPKVRAMEIIDELENRRRGVYAGAIGYFSFTGNMDVCIAIRMILIKGKKGYIQAGAGIVADSVPEREYQETLNKAKALLKTIEASQ